MLKVLRHKPANNIKSIPNIKNIIVIGSGKGGVGKSTIALNLALALQKTDTKVGLLDADIYGPSLPHMIGYKNAINIKNYSCIEPIKAFGLQVMSLGFLMQTNTPAVWRGPMASGALKQILMNTNWCKLDYLVVDLPPGTGDIQLTISQKIPLVGSIIVTTPQDIAIIDVKKTISMFNKLKIPILGIIENMSIHICKYCGGKDYLFGKDGAINLALLNNIEMFGNVPLQSKIRELSDQGIPIFEKSSDTKNVFINIAKKVRNAIGKLPIYLN